MCVSSFWWVTKWDCCRHLMTLLQTFLSSFLVYTPVAPRTLQLNVVIVSHNFNPQWVRKFDLLLDPLMPTSEMTRNGDNRADWHHNSLEKVGFFTWYFLSLGWVHVSQAPPPSLALTRLAPSSQSPTSGITFTSTVAKQQRGKGERGRLWERDGSGGTRKKIAVLLPRGLGGCSVLGGGAGSEQDGLITFHRSRRQPFIHSQLETRRTQGATALQH